MDGRPHILVVDDEAMNRDMLVRRLESRGFAMDEAVDGPSCLVKLASRAFDLVLLDVNMPGQSGIDVLRDIRLRSSHDTLPVILVTALGETDDIVSGLDAGANDYIVKPINLPILLARVKVCLKIKGGVELLMEAERDRVLIETLGNACNQLAQPLTAVTVMLEALIHDPNGDPEEIRGELREVLRWTGEAGDLIHRLRAVAQTHHVSYTQRVELLDRDVVKLQRR